MKKKILVMSLGGSLIVPNEIDHAFLRSFKQTLRDHYGQYKFVIVCGGGSIARQYIAALRKEGKSVEQQSRAGIRATRLNARFVMQLFGKEANDTLPRSMKEVKDALRKNKVVICGGLRYAEHETSDGTAAKLARYFDSDFVNLSNVAGLYTSNPLKYKNARFMPYIGWRAFETLAHKRTYKPGQHFVLDQRAATIIRKYQIRTHLLGKSLKNFDNFLSHKKYKGTIIQG